MSTKDVDCVFLKPQEAHLVQEMAERVAEDENWPDDWLNDGAKGFVTRQDELKKCRIIFKKQGITARMPSVEQLLAMKLKHMAWRDPIDMKDATLLLEITVAKNTNWFFKPGPMKIWKKVEPYLVPGLGLMAKLAFAERWGQTLWKTERQLSKKRMRR